MNEDDEADCDENIHCEVYWGDDSVENDDSSSNENENIRQICNIYA